MAVSLNHRASVCPTPELHEEDGRVLMMSSADEFDRRFPTELRFVGDMDDAHPALSEVRRLGPARLMVDRPTL